MAAMERLLRLTDTQRFFIEYKGFLTNHISHGIIALNRLGASEQRIKQFIDWYQGRLELPSDNGDDTVPADADVNTLLGARRGLYHLLRHYKEDLTRCGSVDALVRQSWPRLAPGMVGAALHGLIHTGYHLAIGDEQGICEGLAYTHYSYTPVVYNEQDPRNQLEAFGKGTRSAISVIEEIRADCGIHAKMVSDCIKLRAAATRNIGMFQSRVVSVCSKQGDRLMGLVNQLQVPDFSHDPAKVLGDFLVETAMTVYHAATRRNDFFLIHGVTGAWSVKHIMCHLPAADVVHSARIFLCCLLATYVTQESPKLEHAISTDTDDVTEGTWREILDKALGSDFDEHVFKLVQVCYDMWQEKRGSPQEALYVACARVAVDHTICDVAYHDRICPLTCQCAMKSGE